MHNIEMTEVSEDFARCWKAAGLQIQNQAQGTLQSWIRANLEPPFLEHLSFRLGNQLFYIQLEDVDGNLMVPGNLEGLLAIADGCAGHACLMPMKRVGVDWVPAELGWGLIDARSRRPINPPALITEEDVLMTDWELQDLAVQVVREKISKDGSKLMSWNGDPRVDPSMWFVGASGGPVGGEILAMHYALLQRCKETFSNGVIPTIAPSAHALNAAIALEYRFVISTCVLTALIGMHHHARGLTTT